MYKHTSECVCVYIYWLHLWIQLWNGFYIQAKLFWYHQTFDTDLGNSILSLRENLTTNSGIVSCFYKLLRWMHNCIYICNTVQIHLEQIITIFYYNIQYVYIGFGTYQQHFNFAYKHKFCHIFEHLVYTSLEAVALENQKII